MLEGFVLKIKRADTPFYRFLKNTAKGLMHGTLPLPRILHPLLGLLFNLQSGVIGVVKRAVNYFWSEPLFRGRCVSIGKRFRMTRMPFVMSHARITIGDDVNFFGKVDIVSGRVFDEPRLTIGNRVDVGHLVTFLVNKEIVIEDDVNIASGVRFMDSDAHPRDAADRIADLPPKPEEIKPVRIGKYAWIGQNAFILKGVTVGEGAVVGVNSVVLTDVPEYSVAMGNPARVVMKNLARVGEAKAVVEDAAPVA